jgi:hypothetical protein
MANLEEQRARVARIVENKRRRDLGSLRNPMDIMEGQYGINDPRNPYLQGIDAVGLLNMTSFADDPSLQGREGNFSWGRQGGVPFREISVLPQEGTFNPPARNPSRHPGGPNPLLLDPPSNIENGFRELTPTQYENIVTHEVGHSGDQALGYYKGWDREKDPSLTAQLENAAHNMLYAHNVGGLIDPEVSGRRRFERTRDPLINRGVDRRGTVEVDPVAAQKRLTEANKKARVLLGEARKKAEDQGRFIVNQSKYY